MENRIREIRVARGMTMAQLEAAAGFAKGTISRMETDSVDLRLSRLRKIAQILGCRPRDLLSPED